MPCKLLINLSLEVEDRGCTDNLFATFYIFYINFPVGAALLFQFFEFLFLKSKVPKKPRLTRFIAKLKLQCFPITALWTPFSFCLLYCIYIHSPYLHYNNHSEYETLHESETEVELHLSVYFTPLKEWPSHHVAWCDSHTGIWCAPYSHQFTPINRVIITPSF